MKIQSPLTKSGIGIEVADIDNADFFSVKNITELLNKHHFIAFKQLDWSIENLHQFLSKFGDLVRNEKRKDDTMLTLDGSQHAKEVLRGKGRMPLHRDGLLMEDNVQFVAIFCLDLQDLEGGRTFISDSANAFENYPKEIKEALANNGFELTPLDTNYYLKNEAKWYPFNGLIERNGQTLPNGGLHFKRDETASYNVRFCNIDEETSYQYFETLEKILMHPDYTYYHTWQRGDMLLFDNYYVMHGREAYSGERSLIQMQVKN
ncbi:MAG: TauD/TfdA family dioxygenase [Chitinophagales bacterium]|nr:TauD/TfdA family dioxygenase [Bacteroidota bacterium]